MKNHNAEQVITAGRTRARHWEIVYHDLIDLYGPKIGLDGVGLWVTYQRFVQREAAHLLAGKAWPSHRGLLADLFRCGQTTLRDTRRKLQDAGLITVTSGAELAARSQEEYDQQLLLWQTEGKPRQAVRRVTLADLATIGITNPARSMIIEVHDPLTILPFCDKFNLTYSPYISHYGDDGMPVWDIRFDDYPGLIRGPNRIAAAVRYIEDNLNAGEVDRRHRPLLSAHQIRSLLRCNEDDAETIAICNRLLQQRARLSGDEGEAPEPLLRSPVVPLPDDVRGLLGYLGWQGPTTEVEYAFRLDPARVYERLNYWLDHRDDVDNPAAAFRADLRAAQQPITGLAEIEF